MSTTTYIKFKNRKRGVPKMDGTMRTCMNCKKKAVVTAVKLSPLKMDVWFCKAHAEYAKSLQ